jgi:hypothetical protein
VGHVESVSLPQRRFGKNNETIPLLGFGTAPGGKGLADADAVRLYHRAIDRGVTYVDTAPDYGRAQRQLSEVLATKRHQVFLVTKTPTADADDAIRILEQNISDLGVASVDLVFLHDLGPRDVDQVLSRDGALAGLAKARDRGLTRYIGFSAHSHPGKALRVVNEGVVDAVMLAMNFADRFTYGFEETVLPAAAERGVAVMAMKVFGGAPGMTYDAPTHSALAEATAADDRAAGRFEIDFHNLALRYALTLPGVTGAVVGVFNEEELDAAVSCAADLRPLSPRELSVLDDHGRRIAAQWGEHFGPVR